MNAREITVSTMLVAVSFFVMGPSESGGHLFAIYLIVLRETLQIFMGWSCLSAQKDLENQSMLTLERVLLNLTRTNKLPTFDFYNLFRAVPLP